MLVALLLAAAGPTPAARDIDRYCRNAAPCVAKQRESLRYFLNLSVVYDAKSPDMERCMRAAKIKAPARDFIDWTVAEQCMRAWSKGRRSMLPGTPGFRMP